MNALNRLIAVVLIAAITLTAAPVPVQAQSNASCDAAISKLETETRKLSADLDEDVRAHVKDEAVENGLTAVRNHLKEKPASEAVFDLRDQWQKFNSWAEATKAFGVTMEDLGRCINTRGCSLIEFAKRQNKVIELWIQSLAERGLGEAGARVAKASSIIKNYVDRTLTTATSGTLSAVNSCIARFEQQATTNNNAVNQQAPQGGGATVKSGSGAGKAVGLTVAAAAAVAGGLYAAKAASDLGEELFSTPTTTSTSGGGSTTTSGGGGGSGTAGVTFQATIVSRSCVAGSNAPEPCVNFLSGNSSCEPTSFTFTISNGTVQACNGFITGTVSGEQFTGNYNGSCGNASFGRGPAVTGRITSTGGSITGTNSPCLGNSYTININVTRR